MTSASATCGQRSQLAGYVSLTKPRITLLSVVTGLGGMMLADGSLSTARGAWFLLSTALLVGAANALNCYLERDSDGLMERTRGRALPQGVVSPKGALGFGLCLSALSLGLLQLVAGSLTSLLGAFALVTYVCLYTPLKRVTPWALFVGAVPGAMPPVLGYAAAGGTLDATAGALFALLFFWQIPHFVAIALRRGAEYRNAGLKTVAVDWGETESRVAAFLSTVVMWAASVALYALTEAGMLYLAAALGLGAVATVITAMGLRPAKDAGWAKRTFVGSLIYLWLLATALTVDVAALA